MSARVLHYKNKDIQIEEQLDFTDAVDTGVLLEQNWMVYELAHRDRNVRMIYSFSIDRDIYIFESGGKKFAFLQAQGSPHTACYVEEMLKRKASRMYRIGTCGSIQNNIEFGDVVLATSAIRDEGTTHQYLSGDFPAVADIRTVERLKEAFVSKGIPTHTGITWTTDGRFVESDKKVDSFSKLGVLSVDMETSALLLVSWLHKIPAASISVVTDKPIYDLNKKFKGEIKDLEKTKSMLTARLYDIADVITSMR